MYKLWKKMHFVLFSLWDFLSTLLQIPLRDSENWKIMQTGCPLFCGFCYWLCRHNDKLLYHSGFVLQYQAVSDLWQKLLSRGVLEERLLDVIWADNIPQKPALLGLMEKFDLIAECLPNKSVCLLFIYIIIAEFKYWVYLWYHHCEMLNCEMLK